MIKLRDILFEGRYDKTVLDLSRNIINAMKSGKKKYVDQIEIESGNQPKMGPQMLTDLIDTDIIVNFKENKKQKFAYGFDGISEQDEIIINIYYNKAFFPMAINDLISELKETLRHELEHLAQFSFTKKEFHKFTAIEPNKDFKGYLLQTHEIPAYVQGLFKRAKTKRITIPEAMEEWYKENKQNFKNQKDWKTVKSKWTAWGKKNLPNAQWE